MEAPDTFHIVLGIIVCLEAIVLAFLTMRQQWLYENIEMLREENRKFHEVVPEAEIVPFHLSDETNEANKKALEFARKQRKSFEPDNPAKLCSQVTELGRMLKIDDLDDLPEKNDMGEPWVDENEETKH